MTEEQKAHYFKIAANITGINIDKEYSTLLVKLYELVLDRKGQTNIDDVVKIKHEVEEQFKEKKESE